jgi:LPS-assembly lipoprotein
VIGYLHTGMEKTGEELSYVQGTTNVTRMDYASNFANELVYSLAVEKLMGVEVPPVDKPNASRDARIQVEIRNALAFKLYGTATGMPPTHRLVLRFNTTRSSLMLDPTTALPSSENYGIDAQYNLIDLATNKSVMTGTTFSRVSYDIPGQLQRFARARAFRDAEDRAANEIAENIQTRLASYFYAGT